MLKTECDLFGVVETMTVLRNRATGKQRDAIILAFRCFLAMVSADLLTEIGLQNHA